jgi:O-antigen/teichoic acid export membrane protein
LVHAFGLSTSFVEARGPLIILLAGLLVAAPLLPFDQLLVVGGEPGAQSRVVVASVFVNLTLSVALVPWLGGIGAAIGTVGAILTLVAGVSRGGRRILGTTFGLWPSLPIKPSS